MALLDMLSRKPDITEFWLKFGPGLESLGFTRDDVKTIEDLTNLKVISSAMEGNLTSKRYLDERADLERRAREWESGKRKPRARKENGQ